MMNVGEIKPFFRGNRGMTILLTLTWQLFRFINGSAQVITFEHTLDVDSGLEIPKAVVVESDGYVIAGTGSDFKTFDGWRVMKIVKIDLEGNLVWQKVYGWIGQPILWGTQGSLKKTSDGGYIFGVSVRDTTTQKFDALLVKFDTNGDTLFTRRFGGLLDDGANSAIETPDGGYAIFGHTNSFGDSDGNYYLVKTDSAGNFLWQRSYGSYWRDIGINLLSTSGNGFLLGGGATIQNSLFQAYIVKTDSVGSIEWDKSYGGVYSTCGALVNSAPAGYIFSSCTDSIQNRDGFGSYLVTKIDSTGEVEWKRVFPTVNFSDIIMVRQIPNGGYIFCGRIDDDLLGDIAGWVVKLDTAGEVVWERRYAHLSEYFFYGEFWDVQHTPDGGFVAMGQSIGVNQDLWVVKLDSLGCMNGYCGLTDTNCYYQPFPCDTPVFINEATSGLLKIYPNPSSEAIHISLPGNQHPTFITVTDLSGKIIYETRETTIALNSVARGLYFVTVYLPNGRTVARKVMVE